MYANNHQSKSVKIYPPNSLSGTIIVGTGSSVTGTLKYPTGTVVDNDFTLYIADQENKQVVKLEQNATSIVQVINTNGVLSKSSALLFPKDVSDRIYISDEDGTKVVLWQFGATTPTVTLTQVSGGSNLNKPRGMKLDPDGNLYVADKDNSRVVMYSVNSTVGIVVAQFSKKPVDIAFDSKMNLYAFLEDGKLLKYGSL